jgi:hypothetical protein
MAGNSLLVYEETSFCFSPLGRRYFYAQLGPGSPSHEIVSIIAPDNLTPVGRSRVGQIRGAPADTSSV